MTQPTPGAPVSNVAAMPVFTVQHEGIVPATLGKRAMAVLIDVLIVGVIFGSCVGIPLLLKVEPRLGVGLWMLTWIGPALLAIVFLMVWAIFGVRLGGAMMGMRALDPLTAEPKMGSGFLRLLLESLIMVATAGIGWALICTLSFRKPEFRTWFDRVSGVVIAENKATKARMAKLAAIGPMTPVSGIVPVSIPALGGLNSAVTGRSAEPVPAASPSPVHMGTPGVPSVVTVPEPAAPASTPLPSYLTVPPSRPATTAIPVQPVELITSTPFGSTQPSQASASLNAPTVRQVSIVQPKPTQSQQLAVEYQDQTVLSVEESAPAAQLAEHAIVDGIRRVSLRKPLVLGRRPQAPETLPDAEVCVVVDPAMSISKTHVAIGADPAGWWVIDLFSTNGVRIVGADGRARRAVPGTRILVPVGAHVEFGSHKIEVPHA